MSNYVTHEEMNQALRRALEEMRIRIGSWPALNRNATLRDTAECIDAALATLPQQPEPQPDSCNAQLSDGSRCERTDAHEIHRAGCVAWSGGSIPARPEPQPIDPLSPAAFVGRTTPDGKPVRWVAWGKKGGCCEDSTEHAPERWPDGSLKPSPIETYNLRRDLANPARAGQTLFVGQGQDPREQVHGEDALAEMQAKTQREEREWCISVLRELAGRYRFDALSNPHGTPSRTTQNDRADGCEYGAQAIKAGGIDNARFGVNLGNLGRKPALTLADIPAELRAEIEAAERERVAQDFESRKGDLWRPIANMVRALGPREVQP